MPKKSILNNVIFYNYLADPWKEGKHVAWSFLKTNHLFFSPLRKVGLHLEKSHKLFYKYRFVASLLGQYIYAIKKQVKLYSLFLLYFRKLLKTSFYRENSIYYRKIKSNFKHKPKYKSRKKMPTMKYKIHVYLWYKKWFRKRYKKQRKILWKSFHRVSNTFWGNLLKRRIKSFIFWMLKSKQMKSDLFLKTYDEIAKQLFHFIKRKKTRKNWKNKYRKYKLNVGIPISMQKIKYSYACQNYQNLFPFINKKQILLPVVNNNKLTNNLFFLGNNFVNSVFLSFPKIHLFFINFNYYFYFLNLKNKRKFLKNESFLFSRNSSNEPIVYFYQCLSRIYKKRNQKKIKNSLIRTGVLIKKKKFSQLQHGKYINIFLYWFDIFLKKYMVSSKFIISKLMNKVNIDYLRVKKYNFSMLTNKYKSNLSFYLKKKRECNFLQKLTKKKNSLLSYFVKHKNIIKNLNKKKITFNRKWYNFRSFNKYTRHKNRRRFFYPFAVRRKKSKICIKKIKVKKNSNFYRFKNMYMLNYNFGSTIINLKKHKKINKFKNKVEYKYKNELYNKHKERFKELIKFKNKIKLGKIKKAVKISRMKKKYLLLKSFKRKNKNFIFYKIKKNSKSIKFFKNDKVFKKLGKLKIHKHKRDFSFKRLYKFNRYINYKKKRRHFLRKYKRRLRGKLYFEYRILPKIEKKRKGKKKNRDIYFKYKKQQRVDKKKLLKKFKTYFKTRKIKMYIFKKKINLSKIVKNKKLSNVLFSFLLVNYLKLLKKNLSLVYLGNLIINNRRNTSNIKNIFLYNVFFLTFLNNLQQSDKLLQFFYNSLIIFKKFNLLMNLVKFYTIKKNKEKLKKYFNFIIRMKTKYSFNSYCNVSMSNSFFEKTKFGMLKHKIVLMNFIQLGKNLKKLNLVYNKIKYHGIKRKYKLVKNSKIFFKKHIRLVYLKKFRKMKFCVNIIKKNLYYYNKNRDNNIKIYNGKNRYDFKNTYKNKTKYNMNKLINTNNIKNIKFNKNILKKKYFKVKLNFLKSRKIKKYRAHRKKCINRYYGKIFRNLSVYKEFILHFIFRLKFRFRNVNRYKLNNLKYRIKFIKGNLAKNIFDDEKLFFFLNNEFFIISNLHIFSAYYNNVYCKSLVSYYDWISLEYSKYFFLNWLSYSKKMMSNSYMFKHYFMKVN